MDILVELDHTLHIGLGFVDMKLDLEKLLDRKVDLVSSGAVSKHIRAFIDPEKQHLYERSAERIVPGRRP